MFSYLAAPLLCFLPSTTEEMVTLYLRTNPHVALNFNEDTQSHAVDAVVLDAVAYTHYSLLGKAVTAGLTFFFFFFCPSLFFAMIPCDI